ncbi:hypothetical protein [Tatumella ptyseos]|nr:hypothetical protein [Tatumella ptyseos]
MLVNTIVISISQQIARPQQIDCGESLPGENNAGSITIIYALSVSRG